MDDNVAYVDDGTALLLALMEETFGKDFVYFDAEPDNIPQDSLPCIIVTESIGTIDAGPTTLDDITEAVKIMVILNPKDYIGASTDSKLARRKVQRIVKGQDPATSYPFEYHKKTIMYAVRKHYTMAGGVIKSSIATEFGANVRSGVKTEEGHVTITIERQAAIPQRD